MTAWEDDIPITSKGPRGYRWSGAGDKIRRGLALHNMARLMSVLQQVQIQKAHQQSMKNFFDFFSELDFDIGPDVKPYQP